MRKKRSRAVGSDGKTDSTHYGGADNPHETIKCLHAWGLEKDALCWNTAKYVSRAGKKDGATLLRDLEKAYFYLGKKIERLKESITEEVKEEVAHYRRHGRLRMSPSERSITKTARALGVIRGGRRIRIGRVNA